MGVAYPVTNLYIRGMTTPAKEYAEQLTDIICLRMRLSGMSYGEMVAANCGYKSRSGARYAVQRALKKNYVEPTEQVRQMEVARIDALIHAHWPDAIGAQESLGSVSPKLKLEAGKFVLELSARKARLLGIDAPTKVDIVGMLSSLAKPAGLSEADVIAEAENLFNQYQLAGRA